MTATLQSQTRHPQYCAPWQRERLSCNFGISSLSAISVGTQGRAGLHTGILVTLFVRPHIVSHIVGSNTCGVAIKLEVE